MTWRDRARPIVARVLAATQGMDERTIRRALRAAYPFGWRANHPYKIWLDEVATQRGLKHKRATEKAHQSTLALTSEEEPPHGNRHRSS